LHLVGFFFLISQFAHDARSQKPKDILIIYDSQNINSNIIKQKINTIDNNIEFKMTTEENNAIDYLDLTLHRQRNKI